MSRFSTETPGSGCNRALPPGGRAVAVATVPADFVAALWPVRASADRATTDQHAPYPDGEVARQYWCQKREGRDGGCGRLSVDQRFADAVVTEATLARLGDPRHVDRLAQQAAKVAATREAIATEIMRLTDEGVAIASKAISWGTARVDAAMAPIDRRLTELRAQLDGLDESPEEAPLSAAAGDVAQTWELADTDKRRAILGPPSRTRSPSCLPPGLCAMTFRFRWGK